jgi:4-carboxymuconolactone decarboxylase
MDGRQHQERLDNRVLIVTALSFTMNGRRPNMSVDAAIKEVLQSIVPGESPVVESIARMHAQNQEQSGLDDRTYVLVRIAALVAIDASVASYLVNLTIAEDVGITADDVRGVLIALGPVVGSARVLSGADKALKAIATAQQM